MIFLYNKFKFLLFKMSSEIIWGSTTDWEIAWNQADWKTINLIKLLIGENIEEFNFNLFCKKLLNILLHWKKKYQKILKKNELEKDEYNIIINPRFSESDYFNEKDEIDKLLYKIARLINILSNKQNLPISMRLLYKTSCDMIENLINYQNKKSEKILKFWIWFNLVQWFWIFLRTLISKKIINFDDIKIKFWAFVNIQEWILFLNDKLWRFEEWDHLIININWWHSISLPHNSWFSALKNSEWIYEINIEFWNNVFLWIWTICWSNTKIWDNSCCWSKCVIWNNCKIWKNVVIWQNSIINDWVTIPDNCIIPENSNIKIWFTILSYDEYISWSFDTLNNNFIIKLDEKIDNFISQLKIIWITYLDIYFFNKNCVKHENELFEAIDIWLSLLNNISWWKIINSINVKWWKITTIGYPKNKAEFLFDILPILLQNYLEKLEFDKIEYILKQFYFPQIWSNVKLIENWIMWQWEFIATWDVKIWMNGWDCEILWTARADEWNHITISNTNFDWVIHWPWTQTLQFSNIKWACIHWDTMIHHSVIWYEWVWFSILNWTNIEQLNAPNWNVVAHNCVIINTTTLDWLSVSWK